MLPTLQRKAMPLSTAAPHQTQLLILLQDLESDYVPPEPTCSTTEFTETTQVRVHSLYGLWVILAGAIVIAGLAATAHYLILKKLRPERKRAIDDRVAPFIRAVSVRSAASAFQRAGAANRQRQRSGDSPGAAARAPLLPTRDDPPRT